MEPPSEVSAPIIKPSGLEVDFNKNITPLYSAITESRWRDAILAVERNPKEAKTWVVRHYEEEDSKGFEREIMWRFLPIHSACARQPSASVITALLHAYPDGAKFVDDQGMYALHYACGNQASRDVIRMLLMNFPDAAKLRDPRGMLPIHYLACWGPSSIAVVDMVLVANRDIANAMDGEGNTPMDLALEGNYSDRDGVVATLERWLVNNVSGNQKRSTRSANVDTNQEEKKEADNDNISSRKMDFASPHAVGRLQHQNNTLEKDQMAIRNRREGRMNAHTRRGHADVTGMTNEIRRLEVEVSGGNAQVIELEKELKRKEHELQRAYDVITDKVRQLAACEEERAGLRQTLADLTEQHDRFKRRSEILGDRLGSLNASIFTMMDQQHIVLDAMNAREEQWMAIRQVRREKMKELIALEEQESAEEVELRKCVEKQTKEMEAIQAVIAAVRQSAD